eukprot:gene11009-3081_t
MATFDKSSWHIVTIWIVLITFTNAAIIQFNKDQSWHQHTEALFKKSSKDRPYIEFSVECESDYSVMITASSFALDYEIPTEQEGITNITNACVVPGGLQCDETPATSTPQITTVPTTSKDPAKRSISTRSSNNDQPICDSHSGIRILPSQVRVFSSCFVCGTEYRVPSERFVRDGYYTLWIESVPDNNGMNITRTGHPITGTSVFRNVDGYLSADLAPLLPLYAGLAFSYGGLGAFWAILLGCYFKDLLYIQFWMGAVIFFGMMEMSIRFGDYDHIQRQGTRSTGLMVFSVLLSAIKQTLFRLLLLVISMGYGIVKPRLGNAFKYITVIGCAYFFFHTAYFIAAELAKTNDASDQVQNVMAIPLAVLETGFLWWIFLALSNTIKILILRNNTVKLLLYSRFRIALAAAVVAGIVYVLWLSFDETQDWRTAWYHEGYLHFMFFGLLVVILYLWRPTLNNQRYAYSLDADNAGDDDFEVVPNFQTDAIKQRNLSNRNQPQHQQPLLPEEDEDLRWVEEHIPSTIVTDTSFPSFPLDSDEELMHTRFELSKME